MSFQDLEAGVRVPPQNPFNAAKRKQQQQSQSQSQDPSQAVAAAIFQINTAVSSFYRLVNSLGTPKDTLDLRDKLWVFYYYFIFLKFYFSFVILISEILVPGVFHFSACTFYCSLFYSPLLLV